MGESHVGKPPPFPENKQQTNENPSTLEERQNSLTPVLLSLWRLHTVSEVGAFVIAGSRWQYWGTLRKQVPPWGQIPSLGGPALFQWHSQREPTSLGLRSSHILSHWPGLPPYEPKSMSKFVSRASSALVEERLSLFRIMGRRPLKKSQHRGLCLPILSCSGEVPGFSRGLDTEYERPAGSS